MNNFTKLTLCLLSVLTIGHNVSAQGRVVDKSLKLSSENAKCRKTDNIMSLTREGGFRLSAPVVTVTTDKTVEVKVNFQYLDCIKQSSGVYSWVSSSIFDTRVYKGRTVGGELFDVTVETQDAVLVAVNNLEIVAEYVINPGDKTLALQIPLSDFLDKSLKGGEAAKVKLTLFLQTIKGHTSSKGYKSGWIKSSSSGAYVLNVIVTGPMNTVQSVSFLKR